MTPGIASSAVKSTIEDMICGGIHVFRHSGKQVQLNRAASQSMNTWTVRKGWARLRV